MIHVNQDIKKGPKGKVSKKKRKNMYKKTGKIRKLWGHDEYYTKKRLYKNCR